MRTSFYEMEQHLKDAIEEANSIIEYSRDAHAKVTAIRAKVEATAQLIELRKLERNGG